MGFFTFMDRIRHKFGHDYLDTVCIIADIAYLTVGCLTLLIGLYLYISHQWIRIVPVSYSPLSAAGLSLATGIGVIMISFVGLVGVTIHRRIYLLIYLFFVILLITLHLFVLFVGNYEKDHTMEYVKNDLRRNLNYTHIKSITGMKYMEITWDEIQFEMDCCGIDGPSDWYFTQRFPKNEHVPDSCCVREKFEHVEDMENCGKVPLDSDHIRQNGCFASLSDYIYRHVRIINFFSFILILTEVFGLLTNVCLYIRIWRARKAKERRRAERESVLEKLNNTDMHAMDRIGDANDP